MYTLPKSNADQISTISTKEIGCLEKFICSLDHNYDLIEVDNGQKLPLTMEGLDHLLSLGETFWNFCTRNPEDMLNITFQLLADLCLESAKEDHTFCAGFSTFHSIAYTFAAQRKLDAGENIIITPTKTLTHSLHTKASFPTSFFCMFDEEDHRRPILLFDLETGFQGFVGNVSDQETLMGAFAKHEIPMLNVEISIVNQSFKILNHSASTSSGVFSHLAKGE